MVVKLDRYLKIFIAILAVSMLTIGTLTPAMAVSPKAYSFEDNLEVALPNVAYEQAYVPGEILVKFNPGVSNAKINAMNSKNDASVTYTSPYAGFKQLKIPKTKSVEEMVTIYSKNPNVEYATANYVMHAATDDPLYYLQWNFHLPYGINVEPAWDISTGDGVVVAVLDTGVAYDAPDLASTNFVPGYDFINNDNEPIDDAGHGTHVTGTIAQSTNNDEGVAGVAFDCSIMPVKVLDADGSGSLSALIDGLHYASNNDVDVISMSLGFPLRVKADNLPGLIPALDDADSKGIVIVAAAGNDGRSKIGYPAAYEKCIAVGATRYDGDRAYYSNYGTTLDIMAPGGDVTIDQNEDGSPDGILQNTFDETGFGYWWYQGTSMATPHVSGVAALLIANGVTGPDNVRTVIENTAQDIYASGWDADSGYGIVDAYAALNYAVQEPVNQEPIAVINMPASANVDETISFDASESHDSDNDIITYSWNFGDNTVNSNTVETIHSYSAAGDYYVSLTVSDGQLSNTATETITISETGMEQPFEVNVKVETTSKPAGRNIFVNGVATIDVTSNGNSVSGAVVSGQWSGATSDIDTVITTDGIDTVVSDLVKYKSGTLTFTFTVDSVTVDGTTYTDDEWAATGSYSL